MPSISKCPECQQPITLPEVADPLTSFECPLCHGRFAAYLALANSTPLPPSALAVESAEVECAETKTVEDDDVDSVSALAASAMAAADISADPSLATDDGGLTDDIVAADGSDSMNVVEEVAETLGAPTAVGNVAIDDATGADSPAAATERDVLETDDGQTADTSSPDVFHTGGAVEISSESPSHFAVQKREHAGSSSIGVFGQLLGMVGGGILGLAIGYWVLIWIGGARADFLGILDRLPSWLIPPNRPTQSARLDGYAGSTALPVPRHTHFEPRR